jgi:hypothetical protein
VSAGASTPLVKTSTAAPAIHPAAVAAVTGLAPDFNTRTAAPAQRASVPPGSADTTTSRRLDPFLM